MAQSSYPFFTPKHELHLSGKSFQTNTQLMYMLCTAEEISPPKFHYLQAASQQKQVCISLSKSPSSQPVGVSSLHLFPKVVPFPAFMSHSDTQIRTVSKHSTPFHDHRWYFFFNPQINPNRIPVQSRLYPYSTHLQVNEK